MGDYITIPKAEKLFKRVYPFATYNFIKNAVTRKKALKYIRPSGKTGWGYVSKKEVEAFLKKQKPFKM